MPSTVIPPGYALLVYRFALASDPEEMVFTIGVELGDALDPDVVAGNAITAFQAGFDPSFWSNESKFVGVSAYIGNDGPTIVGEFYVDQVGTASGPTCPSNCAMLVKKRTGTAGRRGRGRCYFPNMFLNEAAVDSRGDIGDAYLELRQDAVDAWLAELNGGDPAFAAAVVLHTSALAPTPITGMDVDTKIATQRKRMRP